MYSHDEHRAAQVAYYRLCERAARLGIPVSLDDPRSPRTVAELEAQVRAKRA